MFFFCEEGLELNLFMMKVLNETNLRGRFRAQHVCDDGFKQNQFVRKI
jgi:hypothetical protein